MNNNTLPSSNDMHQEFLRSYLKFSQYSKYLVDMKVPFKLDPVEITRNIGSISLMSQYSKLIEPIIKYILMSTWINLMI